MRKNEFAEFIRKKGLCSQWIGYASSIEKFFCCDLDQEYLKNEMNQIESDTRKDLNIKKKACVFKHYRDFCNAHPPNVSAAQQTNFQQQQAPQVQPQNQKQPPAPQAQQPLNNFWAPAYFCQNDIINQDIWQHSPAVQAAINAIYNPLHHPHVGAQQSMIQQNPQMNLPWVPDLAGNNWEKEDSILICGSAYAPFIDPYSGRYQYPQNVYINHYIQTPNNYWPFQQDFLGQYVVLSAGSYYKKIAALMTAAGIANAEQICLFDLCRASFVRPKNQNPIKHEGGDPVVKSNPHIFSEYYQGSLNWTWDRIINSKTRRIIALGTIAEHGLIKLFIQYHANLIACNSGRFQIDLNLYNQQNIGNGWVNYNAGSWEWLTPNTKDDIKLQCWRCQNDFWVINCEGREWHLLPIAHPADYGFNRHMQTYVNIIHLL